jgi:hypothetical protein
MSYDNHRKVMMRMMALLFVLLLSVSAHAADLSAAKQAGFIGEQPSGYLGLVTASVPADVQALVVDVNKKRKAHYQKIANKNGIPLRKVELLAGQKAIAKTPKNQFVRLASGQWQRK